MKPQDLHWFNNISGNTPVNEIGWTWILLALLLLLLGFVIGTVVGDGTGQEF